MRRILSSDDNRTKFTSKKKFDEKRIPLFLLECKQVGHMQNMVHYLLVRKRYAHIPYNYGLSDEHELGSRRYDVLRVKHRLVGSIRC